MDKQDREKLRSMMEAAMKAPGTEEQKQTFVLVSIFEVLMAIEANQVDMMDLANRVTCAGKAMAVEAV
jgi:hypothetical protein